MTSPSSPRIEPSLPKTPPAGAAGLRWPAICALGLLILGLAAGFLSLPLSVLAQGAGGALLLSGLLAGLAAMVLALARQRVIRATAATFQKDPVAGFLSDRNGHVIWRNRAAAQRYPGADPTALLTALGDLVAHPSALLQRLGARALNDGMAADEIVTRAGGLRILVLRTAQRHLIWRIDSSEARLNLARGAEGFSLPMLVAGRGGTVLYANEALRRVTGGRPRSLDQLFPGPTPASGSIALINAGGTTVQAVMIELEGPSERREIYLLPLTSLPAIASLHGLEDLPLALLRLGADGQVLASNDEAREILCLEPGEQANASALFDGPGRPLRDWIGDVLAGRAPGRTETLRLRRGDRPEAFVRLTLRPWGGTTRNGLLAVIVDATEIRSLEAQFTQSQKMQLIGQLAGGIAHDFNNLLTAISGHCDLLLLRHDAMAPDFADLSQIRQNANRAAGLVSQLLAFSRKQTLHAEYLHLHDVVCDMTQLLKRLVGGKVRLDLHHDSAPGLIRADRRQLEQVLMNLVVNARDAMRAEGTITVSTAAVHFDAPMRIEDVTLPAGHYAKLVVRDEGPGIAPEAMGKLFEPFFTTKAAGEGTGLGLSTAYGIVKQSGGFIFVSNPAEGGAEFCIYLPVHEPEDAQDLQVQPLSLPVPAAVNTPVSAASREGAVLLVEDEVPVRTFAARALRLRGYTVIEAADGQTALDLLADPDLDVRLFLSDVIMPGIDGPGWVREARLLRPDVAVVFMSGYAAETFADVLEDLPDVTFLPKPFSLEQLIRTVGARYG